MLRVKAVKELPALVGAGALGTGAEGGAVSRDVKGKPIEWTVPESAWAAAQSLEVAARANGAFGPRPTAIAVRNSLQRKLRSPNRDGGVWRPALRSF